MDNRDLYIKTATYYTDIMTSQLELVRVLTQNSKAIKLAVDKNLSNENYRKTINFIVNHIIVPDLTSKDLQKKAIIMIFEGAWLTFTNFELNDTANTDLVDDIRNKIVTHILATLD